MGFGNTVWVAAGMCLSALYLVCWDAHLVWAAAAVVLGGEKRAEPLLSGTGRVERAAWLLGAASGMGLFLVTRGFLPTGWMGFLLLVGAGSALLVLGSWLHGWLVQEPSIAPPGPRG